MKRRSSVLLTVALCGLSSFGIAASARALSPLPDSPPEPGATRVDSDWEPEPIQWTPSPDFEGSEEGRLDVPIDYDNPDGGMISLYVTRHQATDPAARIGSMLVNPGGPGFGGSILGLAAPQIYTTELVDSFDIVAWGPARGTGESTPFIDCIDDYDAYFTGTDITPDDDAERQEIIDLAADFANQCAENNAVILPFIGTNNSARDMDSIRRALGEEQISYFGWSYGSELGGTWATLFPETVRAAVLDGAADPNADLLEGGLQQVAGFEGTLATYLAECSADPACTFHNDGDAEGAFDQLMLKLDAKPIPSVPGRPLVTRGLALGGVAEAMYDQSMWGQLSDALVAAQQGDGSGLLALFDSYYQRTPDGTWDNSLEAFQSISCMDTAERTTVEEDDATAPLFNAAGPRYAPNTTGGYFCTFFPESTDPRVEITGAGAGPIVVCGATGDAATPLASSVNMANALEDGRLVVIDYDGHTCYNNDPCGTEVIDSYLIDLVIPDEVTLCPGAEGALDNLPPPATEGPDTSTASSEPASSEPASSEPASSEPGELSEDPTLEAATDLLLGLSEEEAGVAADDAGWMIRVVVREGEYLPATMDFRPNRVNVAVTDGEVTKVLSIG